MIGVAIMAVCMVLFSSRIVTGYQVAGAVNAAVVATVISITVLRLPEPSSEKVRPAGIACLAAYCVSDQRARQCGAAAAQNPHSGVVRELQRFFVGIWDLLRSWTYMCLAAMASLGWMSIYLVQNNLYLYTKYALNRPELFDIMLIVALASCVTCMPLWYFVLKRQSKRVTVMIGTLWLILTWCVLIFIPPNNTALCIVIAVLSGGGISV